MKLFILPAIVSIMTLASLQPLYAVTDIEYRQFRLEKVSCDATIAYAGGEGRLDVSVRTVAYGPGAEFNKWAVTGIRLTKGSERIKPDKTEEFLVNKELLLSFPAAAVFAVPGEKADAPAREKDSISGQRCVFNLSWNIVDRIDNCKDVIEITVENTSRRLKETLKANLRRPPAEPARFNCGNMSRDEITRTMDILDSQIVILKRNLKNYKYDVDPEYDEIQKKIEDIEVERALAHAARSGKGI